MSGQSSGASGPSGALGQVSRLLTVVPLLHVRGGMRLREAAEIVGVTPQQLLGDLKVLFLCGLPGGYPDELIDVNIDALETEDGELDPDGLIRVENADYLSRPLRLTPTEATAMIVALRALHNDAAPGTREIVDRALAKLRSALEQSPGGSRVDPGHEAPDAEHQALAQRLRDAAGSGRQMRLTYYVPSRDETTQRVVDPYGVVTSGLLTYLDAWCHQAGAGRLFRLDRIGEAEVLRSSIEGPGRVPKDLREGAFVSHGDALAVRLRLDAAAHWVVEYYPVEVIRRHRDGSLEVSMTVGDARWLNRLLLRLAPHARVVGEDPQRRQDEFCETARATLALYDR